MKIKDKHFLIVGLGRSGLSASRFLTKRGGRVTVTDMAAEAQLGDVAREAGRLGCRLELGGHRKEIFQQTDYIILSPGVPHRLPPIVEAAQQGVAVLGEFELAGRFIREPVVAVTGTNGKTTVTTLIGAMLTASGLRVFVGGNIGNPLIDYADTKSTADVVVAEISSFQLDTIRDFHPRVAVLLNITEDHLDRYPDIAAYARSKMRIFENQEKDDVAVFNGEDPLTMSMSEQIRSRRWMFSSRPKNMPANAEGVRIHEKQLRFKVGTLTGKNFDATRIRLPGRHNMENTAAAALAAYAAGGSWDGIVRAATDFSGLPHRMEPVATVASIRFVNDSKATNVDAVVRALASFKAPVILIMGGRDKSGNFSQLRRPVAEKVKKLILLGEAAGIIHQTLGHEVESVSANDMAAAVTEAHRSAEAGDVVLLSPGCASFDMYRSYSHRGDDFRKAVMELTDE